MPGEGVATAVTIENDIPAGSPPIPEKKVTLVGTEEEIARIDEALNLDLLSPAPPSPRTSASAAPPAATETPTTAPALPEEIEWEGEKIKVREAVDAFKNMKAWRSENDRRSAELAQHRRDTLSQIQATIDSALDARGVKPPPPPPPDPISIPDVGPPPADPDMSTLEGQENYKEYQKARSDWEQKRLQAAMSVVRETTLREVEQKFRQEREQEFSRTVSDRLIEHGNSVEAQFKSPAILKELGITQEQADEVIKFATGAYAADGSLISPAHITPSGPQIGNVRSWSAEDLKLAANALGFHSAERRGREEGVKNVIQDIQNAQAASDVSRGNAAPAPAASSGVRYSAREAYENYSGFIAKVDADVDAGRITLDQKIDILENTARILTEQRLITPPGF